MISKDSNPGDGTYKHHEEAMAVQMNPRDNKKTSSYGRDGAEYRANVRDYVEKGDMRTATAIEVRDVRNAAVRGSWRGQFN